MLHCLCFGEKCSVPIFRFLMELEKQEERDEVRNEEMIYRVNSNELKKH
jgi:hypothetical protein